MHIHKIILLAIATLTSGCGSITSGGCSDSESTEEVDSELPEELVQNIIDYEMLADRWEITCEQACKYAYHETDFGSYITDANDCSFSLGTEGTTPEEIVGSVQCTLTTIPTCEGRRPIGHIEARTNAWGSAAYFANCAHLEAASVIAFEQLATLLHRWGAPEELVNRCWQAAADEVDHARRITALANSLGATVPKVEVSACSPTLLEVAFDNAVEGCVLETWAALRAHWVAQHGKTPEIRELYAKIADDETRHAQLSWDLHEWLFEQLAPLERARVETARQRALDNLPQLAHKQSQHIPAVLGMPDSYAQIELAARFVHGLVGVPTAA